MSVERLVKHARKYGTEAVMEAGVEAGLDFTALVVLQKAVDEIDASAGRRFQTPKRRRLTAETRVRRLLGEDNEEEQDDPS